MATVDLLDRVAPDAADDADKHPSRTGTTTYIPVDDESPDKSQRGKHKISNGYHSVAMTRDESPETNNHQNPFDEVNDTFDEADDPETYIGVYLHIKQSIHAITNNITAVRRLRDNFNLSDTQTQYRAIMDKLDSIMMSTS